MDKLLLNNSTTHAVQRLLNTTQPAINVAYETHTQCVLTALRVKCSPDDVQCEGGHVDPPPLSIDTVVQRGLWAWPTELVGCVEAAHGEHTTQSPFVVLVRM